MGQSLNGAMKFFIASLPHCLIASLLLQAGPAAVAGLPVDVLHSTGKLPARLVQSIQSPRGFVETSTGVALVLDAGTQSVHAIDAARSRSERIIEVGKEPGHILNPSGFALGPNDILAIADAPGEYGRVQYFGADGQLINLFYLREHPGVRVALGRLSVHGAGPVAFTGRTFVFNTPPAGSLMSEFDSAGQSVRSVGTLRPTGHESDPALHTTLNTGLPLVDPTGGFYFVFETGTPMFRKYDAAGTLAFERHIEGPELDRALQSMPTRWPTRSTASGQWPVAPTLVQTAAVDRSGRLWVTLGAGFTYVYDPRGDKIRTVQFEAAGPLSPISLFFAGRQRLLVTPGCYEFPVE